MKNRICVIFSGGTISSESKNGVLSPSEKRSFSLIEKYKETYGNSLRFDCFSPINVLSENMTIENLTALKKCVDGVKDADCDGIIITHGTDTLHYTANLFAFTLNKKIPVVFVSTLYPLDDEKTNGLANFYCAVQFIKQEINGVFVSFKNNGEPNKIHLASRIEEIDYSGRIKSFSGTAFATFENGNFTFCETLLPSKKLNYKICKDIIVIFPYTSLDFSLLKINKRIKAVILKTYHSGTFCNAENRNGIARFAKKLQKKNVPLIIAPVKSNANVYESFASFENAVISYDQSFEATLLKTQLALGNGLDIKETLNFRFANEKTNRT